MRKESSDMYPLDLGYVSGQKGEEYGERNNPVPKGTDKHNEWQRGYAYGLENIGCLFVLERHNGQSLCLCSSIYELRKAVDYWMEDKTVSNKPLIYVIYKTDFHEGCEEWGWCYIPVSARMTKLNITGDYVPSRKFWGKNLLDPKLEVALDKDYRRYQEGG